MMTFEEIIKYTRETSPAFIPNDELGLEYFRRGAYLALVAKGVNPIEAAQFCQII